MPKFRLKQGKHAVRSKGEGKMRGLVSYLTKGAEFDDGRDLDKLYANKFERIEKAAAAPPEPKESKK